MLRTLSVINNDRSNISDFSFIFYQVGGLCVNKSTCDRVEYCCSDINNRRTCVVCFVDYATTLSEVRNTRAV